MSGDTTMLVLTVYDIAVALIGALLALVLAGIGCCLWATAITRRAATAGAAEVVAYLERQEAVRRGH